MILYFLLLPIVFLIGLITSYQDFRYNKIKNKWIVLGLVWGMTVYFTLLLWNLFGDSTIPNSYIFKVFINFAISLLISYLLWYFNLWPAGDAKLFLTFSFLLPLTFYWRSYLPFFPSFAFFTNTFLIALLFLLIQSFCFLIKGLKELNKKKILEFKAKIKKNYPSLLKNIAFFFVLFFIFLFLQEMLIPRTDKGILAASPLFIFIIFYLFRKILKRVFQKYIYPAIGIFILILIFFWDKIDFISLAETSFFYMLLFFIFSGTLSLYLEATKSEHFPFAVFLFFGIILTMILKGSLISFLLNPWSII